MLPIHDRLLVEDHIADLRRVADRERLVRLARRARGGPPALRKAAPRDASHRTSNDQLATPG